MSQPDPLLIGDVTVQLRGDLSADELAVQFTVRVPHEFMADPAAIAQHFNPALDALQKLHDDVCDLGGTA